MPTTRTLATSVLPTADGLRLDDVSIGPDQIVATLEATASRATCPVCGTWSETVHSLYQRTISDLPWGRQAVRLHVRVRKFFCRQPTCFFFFNDTATPEIYTLSLHDALPI